VLAVTKTEIPPFLAPHAFWLENNNVEFELLTFIFWPPTLCNAGTGNSDLLRCNQLKLQHEVHDQCRYMVNKSLSGGYNSLSTPLDRKRKKKMLDIYMTRDE
jgi:hypothetical protein